ncbi:PEPxxWA-CTERM sorting domain-containing protein [Phenylobacterium koreense]|uniref:Ice-binding protein C-terminal domain-containing protein n=1 Tax=Phenylobacterium koreense TaxID=266125 RepID=A0ABV2ELQ8_9CAUL
MIRIIGAAIAALTLAAAASPAAALENTISFGDQFAGRPTGYADGNLWREGRVVVRTEFNELPVDNVLISTGYVTFYCCFGPQFGGPFSPYAGRGVVTGFYLDGNTDVELITGSGESRIFNLDGQDGFQWFAPYVDYASAWFTFRPLSSSPDAFFRLDYVGFSAVPEPATWAMLITGFGLAGSVLRRRRALLAIQA